MAEKAIDTCTHCGGSGVDPQRDAACGLCAGLGEAPTAFGREILALLSWQAQYHAEVQALRPKRQESPM